MRVFLKEIFNVTFVIALLTSLLYIAGFGYHTSFINYLGVPLGLFSASFHEILMDGFYMLFIGGIYVIIPACSLAFCVYLCMSLLGELSRLRVFKDIADFVPLKKASEELTVRPQKIEKIIGFALIAFFITLLLFLLSLFLLKLNQFTSQQGTEAAKKHIEKISKNEEKTIIKVNKRRVEGVIYKCSSSHCAIFDTKNKKVFVYPVDALDSISKDPPSNRSL